MIMIVIVSKPPKHSILSQTIIDPQGFQAILSLTSSSLNIIVNKQHYLHKYALDSDKIPFYARILCIIYESIKEYSINSSIYQSLLSYQNECILYLTSNIPKQIYQEEAVKWFYSNQYIPISPLKIGALTQDFNSIKNDYRDMKEDIFNKINSFSKYIQSIKIPNKPKINNSFTQTIVRNAWNYRNQDTQTEQIGTLNKVKVTQTEQIGKNEIATQTKKSKKLVKKTIVNKKVRPNLINYKLKKLRVRFNSLNEMLKHEILMKDKLIYMFSVSNGSLEIFKRIDPLVRYDLINWWCYQNSLAIAKTQMINMTEFFIPDFTSFIKNEMFPIFKKINNDKMRLLINEWNDFECFQKRIDQEIKPEEINIILSSYALRVSCSLNSENFNSSKCNITSSVSFSLPSFCLIFCLMCGNMDKLFQIVGNYTLNKLNNDLTEEKKKLLRHQALGLFLIKSPLSILYELKDEVDKSWSKILF